MITPENDDGIVSIRARFQRIDNARSLVTRYQTLQHRPCADAGEKHRHVDASREQLDGEDRLNYDLLEHDIVEGIAGEKFLGEYLALNQMSGVHSNVAQMTAMMPKGLSDDELDRLQLLIKEARKRGR